MQYFIYKKQRKFRNVYIYTISKNSETFSYTKIQTLCKRQDNCHSIFLYKNIDTLRDAISMKVLKWAFVLKNEDTFRYITFLYTKRHTLRKKQDNLRRIFIYKNPDTLRSHIFYEIYEIGWGREGGGHFICKKKHCASFFKWKKKCTLRHVFIYKNPDTLRHIFIKNRCNLRYLFILDPPPPRQPPSPAPTQTQGQGKHNQQPQ